MATKTTIDEHKFLISAENDIVQYGKTKKMPSFWKRNNY